MALPSTYLPILYRKSEQLKIIFESKCAYLPALCTKIFKCLV
jgi:hypothetical protein